MWMLVQNALLEATPPRPKPVQASQKGNTEPGIQTVTLPAGTNPTQGKAAGRPFGQTGSPGSRLGSACPNFRNSDGANKPKRGWKTLLEMLDRAHGKPRQVTEITIPQARKPPFTGYSFLSVLAMDDRKRVEYYQQAIEEYYLEHPEERAGNPNDFYHLWILPVKSKLPSIILDYSKPSQ